jgi:hypothetical protein
MATPRPVHGLEDRNPTRSPNTPTARARNLMDGAHGYPLLLFSGHPATTANWLVNSPIRILAPTIYRRRLRQLVALWPEPLHRCVPRAGRWTGCTAAPTPGALPCQRKVRIGNQASRVSRVQMPWAVWTPWTARAYPFPLGMGHPIFRVTNTSRQTPDLGPRKRPWPSSSPRFLVLRWSVVGRPDDERPRE